MSYSLIPTADYKAACDAIRAKTGKTDLIKSGDMASEIASVPTGGGGASFNIHYGTEAPEDTSKLWVETDTEPTSTEVVCGVTVNSAIAQLETTLPVAVDAEVGRVGNWVYIFGGKISATDATPSIYAFNIESQIIESLGVTLAQSARNMAVAVVGTKIYIFGGTNGTNYLSTIQEFDTVNRTIRTLETTLPKAAAYISAVAVGSKIYLFGGTTGGSSTSRLDTINVFDAATGAISTLSVVLPYKTYGMGASSIGSKVYLFGGYSGSTTSRICCFDTETEEISTLRAALISGTQRPSAVTVWNKIFLFGGTMVSTDDTVNRSVQMFDPKNNTITVLDALIFEQGSHIPAAAYGTKVYLFGGQLLSSTFSDLISEYSLSINADANTALIPAALRDNIFSLTAGDNTVKIGVDSVYIGNADGKAEQKNAYLHNGTEWALIE